MSSKKIDIKKIIKKISVLKFHQKNYLLKIYQKISKFRPEDLPSK